MLTWIACATSKKVCGDACPAARLRAYANCQLTVGHCADRRDTRPLCRKPGFQLFRFTLVDRGLWISRSIGAANDFTGDISTRDGNSTSSPSLASTGLVYFPHSGFSTGRRMPDAIEEALFEVFMEEWRLQRGASALRSGQLSVGFCTDFHATTLTVAVARYPALRSGVADVTLSIALIT